MPAGTMTLSDGREVWGWLPASRSGCTRQATLEVLEPRLLLSGQVPYGATWEDTSEFMLGDVWVTVVLLESDGSIDPSTEDWTQAEIDQVKAEVQEGLDWWEDTFNAFCGSSPAHHLEFHVDWTHADNPVPAGYEPINHDYLWQYYWIGDFLDEVGYNAPEGYKTDVRHWNDDQRLAHNADWAYTVFVVDSSADGNGKFTDSYFAYADIGGPFLVMTYDNGDFGIAKMGQILAHETCHIFYGLDEYMGSNSYNSRCGYYNTQNLNGWDSNPDPASRVISLMAEESLMDPAYANHTSSPSSLEMIGWKDSDGDGIFDVLDVPLSLSGSGAYNAGAGQYEFNGTSVPGTLTNLNPRGLGHDITINTVDWIQYRLDGVAWLDGNEYGEYTPAVSQNVPVSQGGQHTIEFRTINLETGLTSNVWSDTFDVAAGNMPPEITSVKGDQIVDEGGLAGFSAAAEDPDSDPLTFTWDFGDGSDPAVGQDVTHVYPGSGAYTVAVTVSDGNGGQDQQTYAITVNDLAPTAAGDERSASEDTPLSFPASDLLANDADPAGDALAVISVHVTAGTHGTVSLVGGTVTYTPEANYHGVATFEYTVRDDDGGEAVGTVTVTVDPVNDLPTADAGLDQEVTDTDEDWFETITLDASASSDVEGLASYIWTENGVQIATGVNPSVDLAVGSHTIQLTVTDSDGATHADEVTITIMPASGPDELALITPVVTTEVAKGETYQVEWLGGDAETSVRVWRFGPGGWGVLAEGLAASDGGYGWNTSGALPGWYCFAAEVHRNGEITRSSSPAWLVVREAAVGAASADDTTDPSPNGANGGAAPEAGDDQVVTARDTPVTTHDLLGNDVDPDGDPLTVTSFSQPEHGTVVYEGQGQFTYTPDPGFVGTDLFTYEITDGLDGTDWATVTVTVL